MKLKSITLILLVLLVFTSCTSGNSKKTDEYYVGTQGVVTNFERGAPPSIIYYDSMNPDENTFDVYVKVHNKGASYTKGGIFLTDYNYNLMKVEGLNIQKTTGSWGDCDMDFALSSDLFTSNPWEGFSGVLNCVDQGVNAYYTDTNTFGGGISDIGQLLNIPELDGVSISFDQSGNQNSFSLSLDDGYNIKYLNRGVGLIVMMSGLSFERYYGREYYLQPNTLNYPGGEQKIEMFKVKIENWPESLDSVKQQTIGYTNCYLYATYASEIVCIDPAPYEAVDKACVPRTQTFPKGQGAPVAISKIEPNFMKNKIRFDIEIKNVGGGELFNLGKMDKCSPYSPTRLSETTDLHKFYILDARVDNQVLECNPKRGTPIDISNGVAKIFCDYSIEYMNAKAGYQSVLILELGYGYRESNRISTKIQRI